MTFAPASESLSWFIVTVAEISISTGRRHLQKMRRPVHECTESIIKASAGFRV